MSRDSGIQYERDEGFDDPFAVHDVVETSEGDDLWQASPSTSSSGSAPTAAKEEPSRSSRGSGFLSRLGLGPAPEVGSSTFSPPGLDVGLAAQAPSLGFTQRAASQRTEADSSRFLHYERRGLWGQMAYNAGYSYFGGLAVGGLVGVVTGLRAAPNTRARILLNSMLNGSGRYGAKCGNAAGVLAMVYTLVERQAEDLEVDRLPGLLNDAVGTDLFGRRNRWETLIPALSAFATGALFAVPRAVSMKGLDRHYVTLPKRLGVVLSSGVVMVAGVAALSVVGPLVFGKRSPFRFSS